MPDRLDRAPAQPGEAWALAQPFGLRRRHDYVDNTCPAHSLADTAARRQAGLAKMMLAETLQHVPWLHDWYASCYHP